MNKTTALKLIAEELNLPVNAPPEKIVLAVQNELARGIHTCSDECQRPLCVAHRKIVTLRTTLRQIESLAGVWP